MGGFGSGVSVSSRFVPRPAFRLALKSERPGESVRVSRAGRKETAGRSPTASDGHGDTREPTRPPLVGVSVFTSGENFPRPVPTRLAGQTVCLPLGLAGGVHVVARTSDLRRSILPMATGDPLPIPASPVNVLVTLRSGSNIRRPESALTTGARRLSPWSRRVNDSPLHLTGPSSRHLPTLTPTLPPRTSYMTPHGPNNPMLGPACNERPRAYTSKREPAPLRPDCQAPKPNLDSHPGTRRDPPTTPTSTLDPCQRPPRPCSDPTTLNLGTTLLPRKTQKDQ